MRFVSQVVQGSLIERFSTAKCVFLKHEITLVVRMETFYIAIPIGMSNVNTYYVYVAVGTHLNEKKFSHLSIILMWIVSQLLQAWMSNFARRPNKRALLLTMGEDNQRNVHPESFKSTLWFTKLFSILL